MSYLDHWRHWRQQLATVANSEKRGPLQQILRLMSPLLPDNRRISRSPQGEMAAADRQRLLQLPRRADEQSRAPRVPSLCR